MLRLRMKPKTIEVTPGSLLSWETPCARYVLDKAPSARLVGEAGKHFKQSSVMALAKVDEGDGDDPEYCRPIGKQASEFSGEF